MSVEAISWACRQTVGKSSVKFVLIALANYADAQGFAWPSVALIAETTEQDRKTVIAALNTLRSSGLLIDTGDKKGGTKQVTVFQLPVHRPAVKSPEFGTSEQAQKRNSTESGTVPKRTGNSAVFPPKGSQKRDTEPSLNHHEPSGNKRRPPKATTAAGRPDDVPEDVWKDFLAHRSKQRAIVTDRVVQEFRAEAESIGWTLAQAMLKSMQRGWRGFEAGWIKPGDLPPGTARQIKVVSGLSAAGERAVQSATAWLAESASNTAQTVEAA